MVAQYNENDPIKAVKKVEEEAEELLKEAAQKAGQMIKAARARAEELIAEAEDAALNEKAKMIAKAEKESEKEVEELRGVYQNRSQILKNKAEQNLDEAVNFIMERIVSQNG